MVLALGTAQLGLNYGVNNAVGGLTDDQASDLLWTAHVSGFKAVDVSVQYREANRRVDTFLAAHPGAFEVLRRGAVGYVSVYTPEEACESRNCASMIQLPANCLDGRMDKVIPYLMSIGCRVIVRSLLLQGLLAVKMNQLTPSGNTGSDLAFYREAGPYLCWLEAIATEAWMTVVELAVRWAWYLMPDVALFGAETCEQVVEIAAHWAKGPLPTEVVQEVLQLRRGIPELVISPRMWKQDYAFTS